MLPNIYDPFQEMEEMMRNLPSLRNTSIQKSSFVPAVDVYETKTDVMVETSLAGVNPKNVDISVEKGILTIQGESKKEREIEEKNYYRKEVRSGSFYRQVILPTHVKEDKITAEYENGVLKIKCPKAKDTEVKKIKVKVIKKNKK